MIEVVDNQLVVYFSGWLMSGKKVWVKGTGRGASPPLRPLSPLTCLRTFALCSRILYSRGHALANRTLAGVCACAHTRTRVRGRGRHRRRRSYIGVREDTTNCFVDRFSVERGDGVRGTGNGVVMGASARHGTGSVGGRYRSGSGSAKARAKSQNSHACGLKRVPPCARASHFPARARLAKSGVLPHSSGHLTPKIYP